MVVVIAVTDQIDLATLREIDWWGHMKKLFALCVSFILVSCATNQPTASQCVGPRAQELDADLSKASANVVFLELQRAEADSGLFLLQSRLGKPVDPCVFKSATQVDYLRELANRKAAVERDEAELERIRAELKRRQSRLPEEK